MCFSQEMSFGFAAVGLFAAWWIYTRTSNLQLASGVFFFFTMEFLQGMQYFFIADHLGDARCKGFVNQILTVAGFAHICMQPYFCHVINASLTKSDKYKLQYKVVLRLSAIAGCWLFARFLFGFVGMQASFPNAFPYGMDVSFPYGADTGKSTEWLRGESLCTFRGKRHLAWSVPMADPSYYMPSAQIHAFMMYAPFFALYEKRGMVVQGLFLLLTGPIAAAAITPNLMEQASIWCFFSIAQICTMLFLIRETLVVHWGRAEHRASLFAKKPELEASLAAKRAGRAEAYPVESDAPVMEAERDHPAKSTTRTKAA